MTEARTVDIQPDKLLLEVLRPALSPPGGSLVPADVLARLGDGGYWVAREVAGAGDADDRFAQAVAVQLDAWAEGETCRADARRLVGTMLRLLRLAQRRSTTTEFGHIATMRVDAWPSPVREQDQPATWARCTAGCSLIVRPPTG